MKIFVTGATGYLGSDIVRALSAADHEVHGLTRSRDRRESIRGVGGQAVVGDLREPDRYTDVARTADALVHVAVDDSGERAEVDRAAVDALLDAAQGRPRVLIYTSGCFVLGDTGGAPAHEDASVAGAPEHVAWRPPHERRVLDAAGPGLATAVIRPGMVYGGTEGAFADLFASARRSGAAEIIGDGENRWSPVYRRDVSRLYRMVLEREASGVFHAAEPAETVRMLAKAASRAAGAEGRTRRVSVEAARQELGGFADAATMDQVVGCRRSKELGWAPEHAPFIESADAVYREWAS